MWALGISYAEGGWWKYQLFNLFLLGALQIGHSYITYCGWPPSSSKLAVHTTLCTVPKSSALHTIKSTTMNGSAPPKPQFSFITKMGCITLLYKSPKGPNISIIFCIPKLRHFKVIWVIRNLHYSWANMDNLLVLKSDRDEVDPTLHVCNMW